MFNFYFIKHFYPQTGIFCIVSIHTHVIVGVVYMPSLKVQVKKKSVVFAVELYWVPHLNLMGGNSFVTCVILLHVLQMSKLNCVSFFHSCLANKTISYDAT